MDKSQLSWYTNIRNQIDVFHNHVSVGAGLDSRQSTVDCPFIYSFYAGVLPLPPPTTNCIPAKICLLRAKITRS